MGILPEYVSFLLYILESQQKNMKEKINNSILLEEEEEK
jgi:hypothetical protein